MQAQQAFGRYAGRHHLGFVDVGRAAEIQRVNGLFAERAHLVAKLAVQSVAAGVSVVSEALRPIFSWNPQVR